MCEFLIRGLSDYQSLLLNSDLSPCNHVILFLLFPFYFFGCRGRRTHKGIDIVCRAGSNISALFPAKVLRRSNPYLNNNADYNTGIYMQGTGKWAGRNFLGNLLF